MNTATLKKRIILESKYLTSDIESHICNKLIEVVKDECSKDYGYILEIEKITKIENHEIGRVNFDNIFTVVFEAKTLNPLPNSEFDAVVCLIYKDGIFVNIYDKQKMLIPRKNIIDYIFNENENTYTRDDKKIEIDSKVKVKITASQYRKKSFSCFGTLIKI
jgi:DNA-directed RNA polymerase subunit E'/Rpb7